jgi:hypothetical protein
MIYFFSNSVQMILSNEDFNFSLQLLTSKIWGPSFIHNWKDCTERQLFFTKQNYFKQHYMSTCNIRPKNINKIFLQSCTWYGKMRMWNLNCKTSHLKSFLWNDIEVQPTQFIKKILNVFFQNITIQNLQAIYWKV